MNQMFFYPDFLESSYLERKKDNLVLSDSLVYGNPFKDQYLPYKDYKVRRLCPRDQKEASYLKTISYYDELHDLSLVLDIYPNANEYLERYKDDVDKYIECLNNHSRNYEIVDKLFIRKEDGKYYYLLTPSIWVR